MCDMFRVYGYLAVAGCAASVMVLAVYLLLKEDN